MIGQPVPLFGSPFADAKGNVWLLSYRPVYPEKGSPYTVISPDGTAQGPAQVWPRSSLSAISNEIWRTNHLADISLTSR